MPESRVKSDETLNVRPILEVTCLSRNVSKRPGMEVEKNNPSKGAMINNNIKPDKNINIRRMAVLFLV